MIGFEHKPLKVGGWMEMTLVITICLLCAPTSFYGQKGKAAPLRPQNFSATGLDLERELTALYLGDFQNARLKRSDNVFLIMLGSYLRSFATQCKAQLPRNKVQMTKLECVRWSVPVNGFGVEVGPRTCVEHQRQPTGLFADPDLYEAYQQLDAEAARNMIRDTFTGLLGNNAMGPPMGVIDAVTTVGDDMSSVLKLNSCSSPGLKRFQDNMLRFATGQAGLRLPDGATLASTKPVRTTANNSAKDTNYSKLLDDLIAENARGWMMNRYVRGSASDVRVTSRDASGRPLMITGNYQFTGFSGNSKGSVRVEFESGVPRCLYFFDYPNTCRSPSRGIINAYETGRYSTHEQN